MRADSVIYRADSVFYRQTHSFRGQTQSFIGRLSHLEGRLSHLEDLADVVLLQFFWWLVPSLPPPEAALIWAGIQHLKKSKVKHQLLNIFFYLQFELWSCCSGAVCYLTNAITFKGLLFIPRLMTLADPPLGPRGGQCVKTGDQLNQLLSLFLVR